jgi:hypothetical protein
LKAAQLGARSMIDQYRTDMQVMDAFDKGSEVLQNRATKAGLREDTPDAWREWTANASPEAQRDWRSSCAMKRTSPRPTPSYSRVRRLPSAWQARKR